MSFNDERNTEEIDNIIRKWARLGRKIARRLGIDYRDAALENGRGASFRVPLPDDPTPSPDLPTPPPPPSDPPPSDPSVRTPPPGTIPLLTPPPTDEPCEAETHRQAIIRVLREVTHAVKAARLAELCGRSFNGRFRSVLAELAAEEVVAQPAHGYYWLKSRDVPGRQ